MSNTLVESGYYEKYGDREMDLRLRDMLAALSSLDIPEATLASIREAESAQFLLLGSATEKNLDSIAQIDRFLRPGKGDNDTVNLVDINHLPLTEHQKRINFLEEWHENARRDRPDEELSLLYPKFTLTQADITQLPIADGTMDIAISDYTLNFLDSTGAVRQTFEELSRVLRPGGILFLAISANPRFPLSEAEAPEPSPPAIDEPYGLYTGTEVHRFPIQTYIDLAATHGLIETTSYIDVEKNGNDGLLGPTTGYLMRCGVFQKQIV